MKHWRDRRWLYNRRSELAAATVGTDSYGYAYDSTTSRILSSTYTAGDVVRTATYLYNEFGEQIGTVLDGVTSRTDITYEQHSNEWWKVETASVIGPHTNSLTITKTQLTELSDSCRRYEVTMVGRADPNAPRTVTETLASFDPSSGIETETVTSAVAATVVRQSLHGLVLTNETSGMTTVNAYDVFGRVAATSRTIGEGYPAPCQSFDYAPCGDLIAVHTFTNGTDTITESYSYDMLGNRIATTDALGNVVFRSYDTFGRVVAEWGATYPVRCTYDTAGRRTSLSTTRDGETWDTTTWAYDAATGNCLSKTYADGSSVTYTYTPDNLPLRTTYASGRWKENVYNAKRQVVGVIYSDGETGSFAYDEFGNEIAASNEVSSVVSLRSEQGDCTNETAIVGNESKTTARAFDEHRRLTEIGGTAYSYNSDGLLASVSNGIALVEYAYTPDLLDAGYALTLSNGVVFSRSLVRDDFRRSLVAGIANTGGGATTESLAYAYDALNRPITRNNDTFGYNARSEVTAANISGVPADYGYDEIGNSTNWTANCLNQYTQFVYDLDGNMTQCGDWAYTYDAANRLKTASSNGVLLVTNFYDAKSRRVKKVTQNATTTFFYDDWNLIEERIAYANGTTSTIHYHWGKDLSGTLQGAGGVGGLLYLTVSKSSTPNSSTQQLYIPCYDNIGNITRYCDANGNTVAQYTCDAFGNIISKSGLLADFFRHRFSTKYYDSETGLYYYGYRFYHPIIMSWSNRDLAEEHGGMNLYAFCCNNPIDAFDSLGLTSVRINVGTESKDSGRGWLNFIKIDVLVVEPPEGDGKLNFIQLKKSATSDWQLDIQGTPGPYYYKLSDVKNYTQKDKIGKDIITLYDAPGGQLDNVDYFTAVVEVNRSCRVGKHPYGFSTINCYDKVKVVASVSWTFNPNETRHYKYSGKQDNYMKRMSMIPSMQQLINLSTWKTELCPSTRVEVTNER